MEHAECFYASDELDLEWALGSGATGLDTTTDTITLADSEQLPYDGLVIAATLRSLGVEDVTLIDVAPYPMPVLGPEIGARAATIHEHHGVKLRMSTSVAMFERRETVEAVVPLSLLGVTH
jgi:NADPH-dependent 2,4-dienoyl-CoA reductase/sulfur reductase-like enzyme